LNQSKNAIARIWIDDIRVAQGVMLGFSAQPTTIQQRGNRPVSGDGLAMQWAG
jgi:hypothetical protein